MSATIGRFSRRQPKSAKSRRAVRKMGALVHENPKKALFLTGLNGSETINHALVDLRHLMGSNCKKLAKRNDFHPFTGPEHLEFLCFKNDCSLFAFGSHNKKRPHNLVLGRHFDFNLLDMIELGIIAADRLDMSKISGLNCCSAGSKPLMIFEGSEFESEPFFQRLKNFFVDFFGGRAEDEVNLAGIDRAIYVSLRSASGEDAVTAPTSDVRGTIPVAEKGNVVVCFRHYGLVQTTSTASVITNASHLKLVDVGPNFDLEVRRVSWAGPPEFKRACRLPKQVLASLKHMHENVDADGMGNLRGHLHVGNQGIETMALRKFKSHKELRKKGLRGMEAGNLTANEAAVATMRKRDAEKRGGAVFEGANVKARKVAAEFQEREAAASAPAKRGSRGRRGKGPDYDAMIGADVDI